MFRSLMVPLDGSAESAAALPVARAIAAATGGAIALVRVPSHADAECRDASDYLNSVADKLRTPELTVQTVVRPGDPASEILGEARDRKADLIVMATHAPGRYAMTTLTSVAHWVVASSPAPVVLVPPDARAIAQLGILLVPVDGSPGASVALGAATALARASGARIELLEVVVPVPAPAYAALPGMTLGGFIDPAWEAEALHSAREYVGRMAQHLRDGGMQAEGHVALGDVSSQIGLCADAVRADIIVMSTHAIRWPGDATLSSVADSLLRTANRPVLLVRREPPAGYGDGGFRSG